LFCNIDQQSWASYAQKVTSVDLVC
jgi:hypothetical protein